MKFARGTLLVLLALTCAMQCLEGLASIAKIADVLSQRQIAVDM